VPGKGGSVRQGSELVDDDPVPFLVAGRAVPGGLEDRVKGGRRAPLDGKRKLGDDLALARLLCHRVLAGHYVVRGDRLEQRAFKQLPAGHHQVGGIAGERGRASNGAGPVLGRLTEAADEFACQVLGGGQGYGAAVETELPAVQPHELGEDRLKFSRGDAPRRRAVMGEGDGGDMHPFGMIA